jgi:cysteine desulfurase
MNHIYLDYNATSPLRPEVYEAMTPYLIHNYGNASSIHWAGRKAKEALMVAKEQVADLIGAEADEVIFTSGGTEANNLALKGAFEKLKSKGKHIITTQIEHKSILDCFDYLSESSGARITKLGVDENGLINIEELKKSIQPDTILISIQTANNETGVIQNISEISRIVVEHKVLLHTDAVQAVGKIKIDVKDLNIDMLTMSSHKINGPKGAGALFLKKGTKLEALIHGGNQERKRRAGTENIPAIVGFGQACTLQKDASVFSLKMTGLRNLLENSFDAKVNGQKAPRIPNTTNLTFKGITNESLLLNLDLEGIAASSGAACSSGSLDPSHVLQAMGHSAESALSSIRFSLGHHTTQDEITTVIEKVKGILEDLQ